MAACTLNHKIRQAVTRKLHIYDVKGNMHEVQTCVEFTITSFATSTEAVEAQMDEAVGLGRTILNHIKPAPLLLSTVGAVPDVVSSTGGINTISAAWKPLLEKMELCTKIVDGISEVS